MGYSYERGAAARNLLRARAHGHEDVISDAETLAYMLLSSDYEDDDIEVEEYIASRYADFTPEAPVITDDMVERAARGISAHWHDMTTNGSLDRERSLARAALEAAFNTEEN